MLRRSIFFLADLLMIPFSYLFLPWLRAVRRYGVRNFPMHQQAFKRLGVFPIRDHYYEPQFIYGQEVRSGKAVRELAIDLRVADQLNALAQLKYVDELRSFASEPGKDDYYLNNPAFGSGDADLYYLLIRNHKPKRIIEIGSGFSTKLALKAIQQNKEEGHITQLTCIEPYEMPWLDQQTGIELIRSKVEDVPLTVFATLAEGDILFIDSSHILRPGNDVMFEYFQLLPLLPKGVLIHIHDIFTPYDYPHDWLANEFRFWNEQYLLEAFLYYNSSFSVLFTVHHLQQNYLTAANQTLIHLDATTVPASFWMLKH